MDEKNLTKKTLEIVADDLNQYFEPVIVIGRKTTIEQLKSDLIAAGNELTEDDVITNRSKEILRFLGVELPFKKVEEKVEKVEEKVEKVEKKIGSEKKETTKATKEKSKKKDKQSIGVIGTILEVIKTKGPIDKEEIHKILVKEFPERNAEAMKKTLNVQIGGKKRPLRIEKDKKIELVISDDKKFFLKG